MPYRLSSVDISDVINESVEKFYRIFHETYAHPENALTSPATRLSLPKQFGDGEYHVRKMPNATFSALDLNFHNDVYLTESAPDGVFFICATLGAGVTFDVPELRRSYHFPTQMLSLGYSRQDEVYHTSMAKQQRVHSVSFFFTEEQLQQCLMAFDRPDLMQQLKQVDRMSIFDTAAVNFQHRYLITRLAENPYYGAMERLYFNSVAGELLISMLESVCGVQPAGITLSGRDRALLDIARNLLLEDMQTPPTIPQLAKIVGLNEDKLKKGFKAAFNNTIFKTLTEHRMQKAEEKVRGHDMSITEIAFDAGYENVSKFIAVFKKTYGVTPGMMRKEISYFLPVTH